MNLADRLAATALYGIEDQRTLLTEAAEKLASVIELCRLRDNSASNAGAHKLARAVRVLLGDFTGESK